MTFPTDETKFWEQQRTRAELSREWSLLPVEPMPVRRSWVRGMLAAIRRYFSLLR